MSIRARLLLLTLTLALGVMLAAGIIGYEIGTSSLETSFNEHLTQIRISKSQTLRNEFENIGNGLLLMTDTMRVRNALRDFAANEKNTSSYISKFQDEGKWRDNLIRSYGAPENSETARTIKQLRKLPLFLQSQFIEASRKQEVASKEITTIKSLESLKYFHLHESIHPFFRDYADRYQLSDILLVDPSGNIVYSTSKALNYGTNLNLGVYSNSRFGDVYRWSQTAEPRSYKFFDFAPLKTISPSAFALLAAPVYDKSDFLGTIIFQIPIERVGQVLSDNHQWKKLGLKDTGEILAFNSDGYLLNNTRADFENPHEFIKNFVAAGGSQQLASEIEADGTTALKLNLPSERLKHYLRTEDLIETQNDYLNRPCLASVGTVHVPGGGTWIVMSKINQEEAVAPFSRYLLFFALGAFILLGIFLLISFAVSKRLVRPLHALQRGLEGLGDGKWNERLSYQGKDEYARVFSDYNRLAEKLENTSNDKEFLDLVMQSLSEYIFVIRAAQNDDQEDMRFIITNANSAAGDAVGLPRTSLVGSDLKLWLDGDLAGIHQAVGNLSDQNEVQHFEAYLKKISGEKIPILFTYSWINSEDSEHSNYVLVATNTSKQKEIERKLRLQENLLRDSQEMARTGSFRWEISSAKSIWSDQLYRILGRDPVTNHASYENFMTMIHPDDVAILENVFAEAQKNLHRFNIDLRMRRADTHESIWVRMVGDFEYDRYGNATACWGIIQDVTDLKKAEIALIMTKDEALKSSQAKSEFLAHMSHEIRTPMNAIMGMAELLRETELNDDQKYYISIFCKAGEVLMALINDVLDLSKIEAGEVSIENIPFDLTKLMSDIQDMMKPRALEKGIDYSFDIGKNINTHLMGDPNKLRQVLINLASNSIKFTERGQIRVNIVKNPTKNDSLMISVSDSGVGIPPSKQHLIFQKFSQADSSITRRYGGTGLGLAISKSLVELMGGQIWFKSREGVGTTFFITVPYREQVYNPVAHLPFAMKKGELDFTPAVTAPREIRNPNMKVRILLADDTEDNRILFTHYLKNGPYEIIEAENGLEALNKVKSEKFDIVFMDVQMPEMDGYAATAAIREWEQKEHRARLPIIALTAHALSDDKEKSMRAGCDDHITKPFKKDTLLTEINRFIGQGQQGEPHVGA